jgi:phenylacetic acid degradation operon negative regulatory protein
VTGAKGRPLSARSVVASVLLGTDPPELPVRVLVGTAELFGISEGTTRVAISRMTAAGELEGDDARYRLAGPLLARHRSQRESRRPAAGVDEWDGTWWVAVVPPGARPAADRADLRRTLTERRLAEWREGLWVRPANLDVDRRQVPCTWMRGRLATPVGAEGEVTDDRSLAGQLWDLAGWADRARALLADMDASQRRLDDDLGELAPAFVLAAAAVRHQRADPLLPSALHPTGWPGADLRARYDRYEAAFQRRLAQWIRRAEDRAGPA